MQNDDIEALVEKRIERLQESLELKQYKQIDASIKEKSEEARKLIIYFFGAFSLLFGIFGIKTYVDIKSAAKTTALEQVRKQLQIDEPNSDFHRDVDRVVARSLIASYLPLLTAKRESPLSFAEEYALSAQDLRRFRDYLAFDGASIQDFSVIIEIIVRSNRIGQPNSGDIKTLLFDIVDGSEKQWKWIKNNPEKRAAVIQLFPETDLIDVAEKLIRNEKNEVLLVACLQYLGRVEAATASKSISTYLNDHRISVAIAAMNALARVDPASKELSNHLQALKASKYEGDWAEIVALAIEIAKPKIMGRGIFALNMVIAHPPVLFSVCSEHASASEAGSDRSNRGQAA